MKVTRPAHSSLLKCGKENMGSCSYVILEQLFNRKANKRYFAQNNDLSHYAKLF